MLTNSSFEYQNIPTFLYEQSLDELENPFNLVEQEFLEDIHFESSSNFSLHFSEDKNFENPETSPKNLDSNIQFFQGLEKE